MANVDAAQSVGSEGASRVQDQENHLVGPLFWDQYHPRHGWTNRPDIRE
jgi:hypothetical protein